MSREVFPIVDALWAGRLDVLVLRTEDSRLWSLNFEARSARPIPLSSDTSWEEVRAASDEAVLMSRWRDVWAYVRIKLDDDGRCVPCGPVTPVAADTSSWRRVAWLKFPFLLVLVDRAEWGCDLYRVDVVSGSMAPFIQSDGEPVIGSRGGFLIDREKRLVALCNGFEVPIFDLASLKQTGVIQPRIAVSSSSEATFRSEDGSILRASYQGLYKSQVGAKAATWFVEHPTLFKCALLGFSHALQAYVLLNSEGTRTGVIREHLPPMSWWSAEAGGVEIPSDHCAVRLNDRGDRVLLLRRNKSIEVRTLGA